MGLLQQQKRPGGIGDGNGHARPSERTRCSHHVAPPLCRDSITASPALDRSAARVLFALEICGAVHCEHNDWNPSAGISLDSPQTLSVGRHFDWGVPGHSDHSAVSEPSDACAEGPKLGIPINRGVATLAGLRFSILNKKGKLETAIQTGSSYTCCDSKDLIHGKRLFLAVLKVERCKLSGTFHVYGIDFVGENVFGVGAGDGKIQTGQQLCQRFVFWRFSMASV